MSNEIQEEYIYFQSIVQYRQKKNSDGKFSHPEILKNWVMQISGDKSIPLQQPLWRHKKAEAVKKEKDVQQKIDSLKTTVSDVVYD